MRRSRFGAFFFLVSCAAATALDHAAFAAPRATVEGPVELFFVDRPNTDGSGGVLRAEALAPVVVRFVTAPSAIDAAALAGAGAVLERHADGRPVIVGDAIVARMPAASIAKVLALPHVLSILPDGSPFPAPRPLDVTAKEIVAPPVWARTTEDGVPLTGKGFVIADVDSGIDPFHPLFFHADGGYFAWVDVDGDGAFTPGKDGVDTNGDGQPETLRVLDSVVTNFYDDVPRFGSDDPGYAPDVDYLYVDANGDGTRNFGPKDGFTEADATYGERLFVTDDVNHDGKLSVGEKIVALGSSKIRSVHLGSKTYRRGDNLSSLPVGDAFDHGTGASSILVGGQRGFGRLVGIAPDADLVVGIQTKGQQEMALTNFCLDEGARVVLHEYAPWQGYHLDGSSPMEKLIDSSVKKGVSHINPAGNLATGDKLSTRMLPVGQESIVAIEAPPDSPYGKFRFLGVSLLWRDTSRDLAVTVEDPAGHTRLVTTGQTIFDDWFDGLSIYAERVDSSRGTARVDVMIFGNSDNPPPIELGTWKLHVVDPAPAGSKEVELVGYVQDDLSGWGKGIHFPDHVSKEYLIGYPGTADHGLAVAAYTGHDFDGATVGERANYSGRGHRIDGEAILSISAPDNPVSAGYRKSRPAVDFVFGGTSGASPHVAGAALLLIQADPTRTGDDVRDRIRKSALVDTMTGAVPNDDYGYGKLRAYQAIFGEDPPAGTAPSISIAAVTAGVGENVTVPVKVADASGLSFELDADYDGVFETKLDGPSFVARFDAEGTYFEKVRAVDAAGRTGEALARIDVGDAPVDSPHAAAPPLQLVAGGGGGCALDPRGAGWGAGALLALATLGLARRRRRR